MQTTTLEISYPARVVYTAVKRLFQKKTQFSAVECNDELFFVEARHGAWISPFSENVKMKVVATSTQASKVVIESSSRSCRVHQLQNLIVDIIRQVGNITAVCPEVQEVQATTTLFVL